ncbi:AAA family ATPase [Myxococcota bacterium]|nr:AAA family ATPase [Myxococcota bacterium]
MTWMTHFGLAAAPFSKELADADLWLPPSKLCVVEQLCAAAEAHEQVMITGDDGTGKTTVLRAARQRLQQKFRLTYCHNSTLGKRDFYRQLCLALGLSPKATAASVFYAVSGHVQELRSEQVHPVFLLDEAHLLHQDTLDHLHILLNYEWDSKALLSLVLVGLPELQDRLALRRNRSLYSRIHWRLQVEPLVPADTAAYLRHRLAQAGCDRELFTSDAVAMLHEATHGAMRDIDRIAHTALRAAAAAGHKLVERNVVLAAVGPGGGR